MALVLSRKPASSPHLPMSHRFQGLCRNMQDDLGVARFTLLAWLCLAALVYLPYYFGRASSLIPRTVSWKRIFDKAANFKFQPSKNHLVLHLEQALKYKVDPMVP